MPNSTHDVKLFDAQAVTAWLNILHGDSPGLINICSVGNWGGRCFPTTQLDAATAYITDLDATGTQGIYLRMTTLRTQPTEPGSRGSGANSWAFPGFWADMDIAGPGHAENNLPPDEATVRQIISSSGLPEPTVWVHSGGGMYPFWLLRQPHLLGEDLADVAAMSEAWQRVIGHASRALGFKYGEGVHDLARVLRIPGTVNRKAGLQRPCRISEAGGGAAYTLDELRGPLAAALSAIPAPVITAPAPLPESNGHGPRPGDDFKARATWHEILTPHGWHPSHLMGHTQYWVRPGKNPRDGDSATTGHDPASRVDPASDRLFVFSTSTVFPTMEPIDKFHAYSILEHGGDHAAAARTLRAKGYGQATAAAVVTADPWVADVPQLAPVNGSPVNGSIVDGTPPPVSTVDIHPLSDVGNGRRLADRTLDRYLFVSTTKRWVAYDGKVWKSDEGDIGIETESVDMLVELGDRAMTNGESDLAKHFLRSQAGNRPVYAVRNARLRPGMSCSDNDFDTNRDLIACNNGVLDLRDGTLHPHSPAFKLTRAVNANYTTAAAPHWERYLEQVLPDTAVRAYAQRLAGYTLLGNPNQRVLVAAVGASGTGKSTFIETLSHVFGQFAQTAAASTFLRKREGDSAGLDPMLHALRGARFVSTSEASDRAHLEEALVKRVTGSDQVTTRTLHEKPQEWLPQFTLWMATNFMPRINTEDQATWDRVKILPFDRKFENDEQDRDLPAKLRAEADGIFAWIIQGLIDFKSNGLQQPKGVTDAVSDARREDDTVVQWLDEGLEDGTLVLDEDAITESTILRSRYEQWCLSEGHVPKHPTVFGRRLVADGRTCQGKISGRRGFKGIRVVTPPGAWIAGGFHPRQ